MEGTAILLAASPEENFDVPFVEDVLDGSGTHFIDIWPFLISEATRGEGDLPALMEPGVADEEVELELLRRRQQRAEGVA